MLLARKRSGDDTFIQLGFFLILILSNFDFQVRDCRTEPILHTGLVLTWTGYDDINGGVERMVPSHCSQHICPPGYTGPECDQLTVDKVLSNMYSIDCILYSIPDISTFNIEIILIY